MGSVEGQNDGYENVGCLVGAVGAMEGVRLGRPLGSVVGSTVGRSVGILEVGFLVGISVVGEFEGR